MQGTMQLKQRVAGRATTGSRGTGRRMPVVRASAAVEMRALQRSGMPASTSGASSFFSQGALKMKVAHQRAARKIAQPTRAYKK